MGKSRQPEAPGLPHRDPRQHPTRAPQRSSAHPCSPLGATRHGSKKNVGFFRDQKGRTLRERGEKPRIGCS